MPMDRITVVYGTCIVYSNFYNGTVQPWPYVQYAFSSEAHSTASRLRSSSRWPQLLEYGCP